ncbi:tRNA(Ile)-lysidine synthase [Dyadobacter beijingensis]|uniref:tRNA(Ile)-lysidine synthase n=1 Tax=Dyadobacter beijingensis TaxID=365489 RepID=A0ABQ2HJR1_9BACT|nr:tRNA lysidine(34) synthetase TilS [Dyadobacter beijingensis]GGM82502.1 tRNA(Ile)-lysidine synthase [Dyadobacter beijingensis]
MLDSFLTFINQHTPDLKQQPTLLAVSGGIDSVVMLHLFHNLRLPAGVAHCNFGLRGADSDGDEAFVRALAERFGFPFFVTRPDVKSYAKTRSVSTQMAARDLRYEWFEEIRKESGYEWVATAHHANDSLETLLLNLARGTGLPGLCGIAPVNGRLIRPLLYANRAEVGQYAVDHHIDWREDITNASDDYDRNKVRHHIVPVLAELNPSLETTFNASAERLRAANALLDVYLQEWKTRVVESNGGIIRIPIHEIRDKSEPAYRLWTILQNYGFQYSQMRGVVTALSGISGKTFLSPTHTLLIDREYLSLKEGTKPFSPDELIIHEQEGIFEWQGAKFSFQKSAFTEPPPFSPTTIAVDAGLLTFPLTLRTWQEGDIFQPFGMGGKHKKVSDLLIDRKADRFEKGRTGILLNGNGEIVWVAGIRADERFRITENTADILIITLSNLS